MTRYLFGGARKPQHLHSSADFLRQVLCTTPFLTRVLTSSASSRYNRRLLWFFEQYSSMTDAPDDFQTQDGSTSARLDSSQLLEPELARECVQICTQHRAGAVQLSDAILRISATINSSQACAGAARDQAFGGYLRIIENDSRLESILHGREDPRVEGNRGETSFDAGEPGGEESRGQKRKEKASDEDEDNAEEERSDFDVSTLPWEIAGALFPKRLSEELQKTNEMLRLFAKDYKRTKTSLLTNTNRPEFPETEWANILHGRPIDLDKVISSLLVVGSDAKQVEKFGNIEFRFANSTPIKKISTQGEWSMAWNRACEAVEFVFSHRKNELRIYSEYMLRKFTATNIGYHDRIINFDKAVRERAAHRSDISLSDTASFADLADMHTSSMGSGATSSRGTQGSTQGSVQILQPSAGTVMSVQYADKVGMQPEIPSAANASKENEFFHARRRPRFARDLLWDEYEISFSPSFFLSLSARPLPTPTHSEFNNAAVLSTIPSYPYLFKITTPINVDHIEALLSRHPNQPFVESVCRSLREGFWPWASSQRKEYPITWDNSHRPIKDTRHQNFLREQRDEEIRLGQYSESFGTELLPGMYSMPIGVVPKPHSDNLRLVNDFSAGEFSLNSMIPKSEATIRLDGIRHLGVALRRVRKAHPRAPLILFKSDVSRAYRLIPMHPLWQIKQVVTIDGHRHVDRCNCFGGRAGGRCWCSFYSLVLWIAEHVWEIKDLFAYIDDNFSWEFADRTLWYDPYQCYLPRKQARLLMLWDFLGIPHKKSKQVFGQAIKIIGYHVDIQSMQVTMDHSDRQLLIDAIHRFCDATFSRRHTVREFQRLAGWINWGLNVEPRLRPGLASIYAKLSGKEKAHQLIYVNRSIKHDLSWLAKHFSQGSGIYLLDAIAWDADDADMVVYTDSCLTGMGFWSPNTAEAFYSDTPSIRGCRGHFLL
ncbi:hypothetical protein M422DRAFT_781282 [Sphaerobolus stellatus SS14]|uniref:Uncharacterized protein n=1 Tax=Sphaerobolus stellatus (strain SS14) TaxID=990650 RepID=A0A0C9U7C7_SPHS4|nr:hypothetical protein M422DRAFT_781282 [Sphaerobolus stellatus SS14]